MSDFDLALRKLEGALNMVKIGNVEGFDICNMKGTEKRLADAIKLLNRCK